MREIQEYLFEHKVPWYSSGYGVGNTDKPFLFAYPDYGGWKPNITYSRYRDSFNDSQLPEKWFYDGKIQDQAPENTLLEELHSVLDKYNITISLVQDCDNNPIMLLESGSDETLGLYFEGRANSDESLGVYFEGSINSEAIQEYIDSCTIRDAEFEQSRQFEPHIVNYLGKDIPVPYTFKRGWLATDEDGDLYVYRCEPVIDHNEFSVRMLNSIRGIDYEFLGKMNFKLPYKKWKESKLFFDISEDK